LVIPAVSLGRALANQKEARRVLDSAVRVGRANHPLAKFAELEIAEGE